MYVPRFNAMADADVGPFLAAHPAGHLVTVGPDGRPDVTLLPLVLDEGRVLAHFARANDHWRRIAPGSPGLVVVTSAHRGEAFDLCRAAIDRIKETVPVWKKEWSPDGSALWVNLERDERY